MEKRERRQRLADLRQTAMQLQLLYENLQHTIRELAAAGASWEEVGEALGMSAVIAQVAYETGDPKQIFVG